MRDALGHYAPHLRHEHGPDRPWRGAVVVILTVAIYALLGVGLGLVLRAWWGLLA